MVERGRILVDGDELGFNPGQSVLEAMLSAGRHPVGGGCLCAAGDCPYCLATVEGVGYVRTCQVAAAEGLAVVTDHRDGAVPPLPLATPPQTGASSEVAVEYRTCDVVVVGKGASGRGVAAEATARGAAVLAYDARCGQEALGIYPGPLVVVRTPAGMIHVEPSEEIVVATGAAEIQPVAPGNHLAGIVTAGAAARLATAGVDLGRVVALGAPPDGVAATRVPDTLVRFEGEHRVVAVVVGDVDGREARIQCDTVALGLGRYPRDALARMASGIGGSVTVRTVGGAALPAQLPPCPAAGLVCPCAGIEVEHLHQVWDRGFREMELLKRATLAGTGTCQGSVCLPYLRSFLAERGGTMQPAFTARPLSKQQTIGEIAAGAYHRATQRTALDAEHRTLGAQMERAGGWWRPWTYGAPEREYRAVREAVSVCDVSTLGKARVSGPDAIELLQRLYPTDVTTIRPGRSRYAMILDERGYVLDDGLICRELCADGETRFRMTFTSGGSTMGELWLRDWAESWGLDVRLLNETTTLGAINVTGPLAAELLQRAGAAVLPPFGAHAGIRVAGVECHVFRLSFTGELSYELHHPAVDSVRLWRELLDLGADLGCVPHGLATLMTLRLEKGHIIVGQDTDYDSTPRRLGHAWAVNADKSDFVGRASLQRTDRVPLDRRLVGIEMDSPAPIEGAIVRHRGQYMGYLTSSADSPALGRAVMLGWVNTLDEAGTVPDDLTIDSRPARRATLPFYDPDGGRARADVSPPAGTPPPGAVSPDALAPDVLAHDAAAQGASTRGSIPAGRLDRIVVTRIVASEEALVVAAGPLAAAGLVLPIAPDEVLLLGELQRDKIPDVHAIVVRDSGFAAGWWDADEAASILAATCEWPIPRQRPAFAQGAVADLPVRLWFEMDRVLFVVPAPFAGELQERIGSARRATESGAGA